MLFKNNNLNITIETNLQIVNFLEVTLDISNRKYWPYSKPNNIQQYINTKSKQPPPPTVFEHLQETQYRAMRTFSTQQSPLTQKPWEKKAATSRSSNTLQKKTNHAPITESET